MRINEIAITETIDNLFQKDVERRTKYASQIFNMLQQAYSDQGGIHGSGFNSEEDMIKNIPMWKVFRRGDDIKVVMMYKDKEGRKRVAIATDGSSDAKSMLAQMIKHEATSGRAYGEISGKSLGFTKKVLGDEFKKILVPYKEVIQVLKQDYEAGDIEQVDDYAYNRKIGGNWHEKVMVGTPGKKIVQ